LPILPEHLAGGLESRLEISHIRFVETIPEGGPERTVALRKLLEAKDAAVRAKLVIRAVDHHETRSRPRRCFYRGVIGEVSGRQLEEVNMSEEAEKIIRDILEIVEKERKECSWKMFDGDDTPWGGFEWACERIYETIADRFQIKETGS
jgi:hypothetical protein